MSAPAHPSTMTPSRTPRTRTSPPRRPDRAPFGGNYLWHTLFGASGLLYILMGFLVLEAVWRLGSGPEAWSKMQRAFASPLMIAVHGVCFGAVIFVGVRFFGLFPKAQPPRLGPAKPPPRPVIAALLYAAWIGVSAALAAVLAGGIP